MTDRETNEQVREAESKIIERAKDHARPLDAKALDIVAGGGKIDTSTDKGRCG